MLYLAVLTLLSFNSVYLIMYLYASTIKLLNPHLCDVL